MQLFPWKLRYEALALQGLGFSQNGIQLMSEVSNSGAGVLASKRFGIALSARLLSKTNAADDVAFTRLIAEPHFSLGDISPEDAYSMHVNCISKGLLEISKGKNLKEHHSIPLNGICLYDLTSLNMMKMTTRFDMVRFYFPHRTLQETAYTMGHGKTVHLSRPPIGTLDPIITHLTASLVSCFDQPERTPQLFLDQIGLAAQTHLLHNYGENPISVSRKRAGLLAWQESLAKELIEAELGEVSIARIADECGLSASYFVRAFRETTGMPPYKWLTALRIEKVKALLATSSEPLNEIALACGFADQSHMGRAFLKHTGLAPGQWRRRYR